MQGGRRSLVHDQQVPEGYRLKVWHRSSPAHSGTKYVGGGMRPSPHQHPVRVLVGLKTGSLCRRPIPRHPRNEGSEVVEL